MRDLEFNELGNGMYQVKMQAPPKPTAIRDKSLKIIKFGSSNNYPQQLIDVNSRSPLNNSCVLTAAKFMYGDGFIYPETHKSMLEQAGITNRLLEKICYDEVFAETVCTRVKYRPDGLIGKLEHFDFATVRLALPPEGEYEATHAWISCDWENYRKPENKPFEVELYDPVKAREFIAANKDKPDVINGWFGQLVIWRKYRAGQPYYSIPRWASALNWVYVDGEIGKFQAHNIDNNFFPGVIISVPGQITGKTEDGRDKKTAFKDDMKERFAGSEKAGEPMVIEGTKDNPVRVIKFESNTNSELFSTLKTICDKQIVNAWGIPNAISNIETPGKLGSSQEIAEATQYYQNTQIRPEQNHILEMFNTLIQEIPGCKGVKLDIANSTPVNFIDEKFLNDLTQDERRKIIGYEPLGNVV